MHPLLQRVFNSFIEIGNVRVTMSSGRTLTLGDGTGKAIGVRFTTRAAELGVLLDPELKLGEAYMNGTFVVEEGSIADVIELGNVPGWCRQGAALGCGRDRWPRRIWARLQRRDDEGADTKKSRRTLRRT